MKSLPYVSDDILYIVCTQLWHERDYGTLFSCGCSGKQLATIALMNLYRMPSVAPLTTGISNKEKSVLDRLDRTNNAHAMRTSSDRVFKKRARLWQTLIRAGLGIAMLPYCQYIRTLNLGDLEELLSDCKFRAKNSREFFSGELEHFRVEKSKAFRIRSRLNINETITRIGEGEKAKSSSWIDAKILQVITRQTTLLEELTGNVLGSALSRWVPRLPRLTHLKLRHDVAVEGIGTLIRLHCPLFKRLDLLDWMDPNPDQGMASFLNELRPQSLESFEALSSHNLGSESLQAFSCHAESLTQLKLNMTFANTVRQVSLLGSCTNLVSLSLAGTTRIIDDDALLEAVAWLKACKNLRVLAFRGIFSAPALLVPVLLENSITLTSLEYEGLVMPNSKMFFQALANQTSLQSLLLRDNVDEDAPYKFEEADDLVDSISKLINLTDLRVTALSDFFADRHILQLASNLPKLEVLSTRGLDLTDAVWDGVASLRSLRKLDLGAMTSFTPDGILGFIERLGAGNKGLVFSIVSVMNANVKSWVEQGWIRDVIAEKVQGTFEHTSDPRIWFRIDPENLGPGMSLFPDQVQYW